MSRSPSSPTPTRSPSRPWRAPVYRTPGWIIAVVQLARLVWWLARLIIRHPVTDAVLAVLVLVWLNAGWPGLVALVLIVAVVLAGWRWARPVSFSRWIAGPARGKRRSWFYRRRWGAVMTVAAWPRSTRAGYCCRCSARSPPPATPTG